VPKASDERSVRFDLISDILAGSKSSRLYQKIVKEKQLASSINAFNYSLKDDGLFIILATLQQGKDVKELENAISEEITNIVKNGISGDELKIAKNSSLASFTYNRESVVRIAFELGNALINTENPQYINIYPQILSKISPNDINEVIKEFFKDENKTTVVVYPIPPSDIEAYLKGLEKAQEIKR
jgi:zinc protease